MPGTISSSPGVAPLRDNVDDMPVIFQKQAKCANVLEQNHDHDFDDVEVISHSSLPLDKGSNHKQDGKNGVDDTPKDSVSHRTPAVAKVRPVSLLSPNKNKCISSAASTSSATHSDTPYIPQPKENSMVGNKMAKKTKTDSASVTPKSTPSNSKKRGGKGKVVATDDGEQWWLVETVLEHRVAKQSQGRSKNKTKKQSTVKMEDEQEGTPEYEFRVKWVDYDKVDKVWYPESMLTEYAINKYFEELKAQQPETISAEESLEKLQMDGTSNCELRAAQKAKKLPPQQPAPQENDFVIKEDPGQTEKSCRKGWWKINRLLKHRVATTTKSNGDPEYEYRVEWRNYDKIDLNWYHERDVNTVAIEAYHKVLKEREERKNKKRKATPKKNENAAENTSTNTSKASKKSNHEPSVDESVNNLASAGNIETLSQDNQDVEICDIDLDDIRDSKTEVDASLQGSKTSSSETKLAQKPEATTTTTEKDIDHNSRANKRGNTDCGEGLIRVGVVRSALLRGTRCPGCSDSFSADINSDWCPYQSQACGHSICANCLVHLKDIMDRTDPTSEWWPCPIRGCLTDNAFSTIRAPSVNTALIAMIEEMNQVLPLKKDDSKYS